MDTMPQGNDRTEPDPSMEDILNSIRRILKDDAEPAPEEPDDGVFRLTPEMMVAEPPAPVAEAPAMDTNAPDWFDSIDVPAEEPLLAPQTAQLTAASLDTLRASRARPVGVYRGGPTIEDVVREEMRPILKEWLDENLPPLVERLVRAEIERITEK